MNAAQRPWSLAGFAVNAAAFGLAIGFGLCWAPPAVRLGVIIAMSVIGIILHFAGMLAASRPGSRP